ncbi:MFS transporter [Clostridium perfringens]|uniref:Glycerol-3-phosphate transporter n=1 Tax=Clostridium perfringens TaxID=1502 RepID=A0A2X2YHW5_CLOPF|nr:MFS transporter [Clostridium perfringens]MCI5749193.1 MFS transporter [Clostridium perfringens]MDK0628939.1 MFS transporter [Clostridium perfringens]MDM0460993.1 MFS transporter [Clostridium perfringens]MDV5113064.1 MFS transporter [Clostridium perfringens]MDY4421154.1 MFS transporter [Clostridium perfringens]
MISFLQPAPAKELIPEDKVKETYKKYRIRVFLMIILGYMCFYLVRKNFSMSAPLLITNLHFSKAEIGLINSAFAISYGLSKFVLGTLADKSNVKKFLMLGLLASATVNIGLAFSTQVWMFVILMIFNGIFQSMGAPACHIVIGKWFKKDQRGLVMSTWNTSHNIGGGLVGPLSAMALFTFGANNYKSLFLVPAVIAVIIALIILVIGSDTPESVGLPKIKDDSHDEEKHGEEVNSKNLSMTDIMFKYVLKNKYVWILAITNIFIYIVRQGMVDWIPVYLTQAKGFSFDDSSWAMFLFEYAAIPSTILIGWLSDKVFKGNRAPLGIICMLGVFAAVFAYWKTNNLLVTMIAVAFVGCFIYGPAMLVNLSLIDLVPKFVVGSADGFAGLTAYLVGQFSANFVIGLIADSYGWNGAFTFILIGAVFALLGLVILQITVSINKKKI